MKKPQRKRATFFDRRVRLVCQPAVAAAGADDKLVVASEAGVGHVSRVSKVALVFGLQKDNQRRLARGRRRPATFADRPRSAVRTNFSEHGKSKSLMRPKSSPVTKLRPARDTQAQLTSALSALRGQMPRTSSPRMLRKHIGHIQHLPTFSLPYGSFGRARNPNCPPPPRVGASHASRGVATDGFARIVGRRAQRNGRKASGERPHLVHVAQVILSTRAASVTILPEGTSCTCRV